ncbi:hypothetical protein AMAG_13367 [Allomyces macrogynus ATCC 38327]|uniref:Cyclin N-terminal domain-containing protein n=1 Tax=Allomyces macrogynus (strain ATCC 38327) TaxID=578462 RepID=A0A0L0T1U7_ALLM3|nr:hypothetical protein AMAG_13367 [Allomyces macrogynus ATCC 38327]|eukprot:KNE68726.1 hypothetical protein AMAG_13367 [Allomyces macrogynus ATCC 38327]
MRSSARAATAAKLLPSVPKSAVIAAPAHALAPTPAKPPSAVSPRSRRKERDEDLDNPSRAKRTRVNPAPPLEACREPRELLKRMLSSSMTSESDERRARAKRIRRIASDTQAQISNSTLASSSTAVPETPILPPPDALQRLAAHEEQWQSQRAVLMYQESAAHMATLRESEDALVPIPDYSPNGAAAGTAVQAWGWEVRAKGVDWMIQAARYLDITDATVVHALRLCDELFATRAVAPECIPLVGTAALWIVAKLHERKPPSAAFLADMLDHQFTPEYIAWAEVQLLDIVHFRTARPTAFPFLHHLAAVDSRDPARILLATYLILCAQSTPMFLNVPPSVLAAAAYLGAAYAIAGHNNPDRELRTVEPTQWAEVSLARLSAGASDLSADSGVWTSFESARSNTSNSSLSRHRKAKLWTSHHERFALGRTSADLAPVTVELYRAAQEIKTYTPAVFHRFADDEHQGVSVWFAQWVDLNKFW